MSTLPVKLRCSISNPRVLFGSLPAAELDSHCGPKALYAGGEPYEVVGVQSAPK
jgi:hypothetical protein